MGVAEPFDPRPAPGWRDARVSVVVPFRDQPGLLRNCLNSLARVTTLRPEVVLVDNGSTDPRTHRLVARQQRTGAVVVADAGPFNFSRLCNAGAAAATGDYLLFLNSDTEGVGRRWLARLTRIASDPRVGAVGATLLYPDRTLQHAGLFPRADGLWVHPHRGRPADFPGDAGELLGPRTVPAVTAACMLLRRDAFDAVGGFDEAYPVAYNDVDLCVRLRATGRRVVMCPSARLYHYEGVTRGFTRDTYSPS